MLQLWEDTSLIQNYGRFHSMTSCTWQPGGSSSWAAGWKVGCASLLPNADSHGQNMVMYQMYVISNLTSLKKKEIKILIQIMHIRCYYILLLSYGCILLLPRSKESIPISWGPAELILVFEQLDLLWRSSLNLKLQLTFLILPDVCHLVEAVCSDHLVLKANKQT